MKWLHGRTSGVFGAENNLAVTLDSGMTVKVSDGVGWLSNSEGDGSVFWNDNKNTTGAELKLTAAIANAVNPRIDRVVVTWDTVDYAAKPRIELLQGTPASSPAAPTLTNNTLKRQISLAQIYVAAAASKLTSANITDERLDKSVCGIVTDWVTVDTTTMNQQFAEYLAAIRKELSDLNAGTATMLKATYDPKGRAQDIFAYADSQGVHLYQHTKVGTVHKLTGSGASGRVKLTANVAAGDTVQVNGKTVPAYVGAETFAAALAGEALSGRWLSFVWDGTQVNFNGGGGLSNSKLALADADTGDVISGKKFYSGDKTIKKGSILPRNTVGKNGAVGGSANWPSVPVTPVTRNTQVNQNTDGVNRLSLQPPAGYYNGDSYVGETYTNVAAAIGLTAPKIAAGETVLDVPGTGHCVAMFAAVGDNRWSGGSYNRLKLAYTVGGTSGFGGWGCWLPAGTYRVCGAITLANCYVADAGSLSTKIYAAERVYGQNSIWGGQGTFTLNGSQWVSVTSGSTSYSECGAVCIYRV
nr:MAG TPA: Receptor Binding Protein [Caudoviricetes sp.]